MEDKIRKILFGYAQTCMEVQSSTDLETLLQMGVAEIMSVVDDMDEELDEVDDELTSAYA